MADGASKFPNEGSRRDHKNYFIHQSNAQHPSKASADFIASVHQHDHD